MKPLLLTILLLFFAGCTIKIIDIEETLDKEKPDIATQAFRKAITEFGIVYIGMPKENLEKAGYTELLQKGYRKEGNEEWITFSNWSNQESDLVTFYIVDGKVKGWEEE